MGFAFVQEEGLALLLLPDDDGIVRRHFDHHEPLTIAAAERHFLPQALFLDLHLQLTPWIRRQDRFGPEGRTRRKQGEQTHAG